MVITSTSNEIIKEIKKLHDKKNRDSTGLFLIEGIKMIKEAIKYNAEIVRIIIQEGALGYEVDENILEQIKRYNLTIVSNNVFKSISDVKTPQGIMAIVKKNKIKEIDFKDDYILMIEGIQDPGNLGTIIRTADSANIKQIIISNDTVDTYSPKIIRATMGAIFRVNIIETIDFLNTIKKLQEKGFQVLATSLQAEKSIYELQYNKKVVIIGNEGNGVSEEAIKLSDDKIKIPMIGKAESLNVAVATGIIIYEYIRQKLIKGE